MEPRLLLLFLLLLLAVRRVRCAGDVGHCRPGQDEKVWEEADSWDCRPRPTVVAVPLLNDSYSHVYPRHVTVARCGGSCPHNPHYRCRPEVTSSRRMEVVLIPRSQQSGVLPSYCTVAEVEEHSSCYCSCTTTSCPRHQTFLPDSCSCVCADPQERNRCIRSGWHWDASSCQCVCPEPWAWPQCPTSYYYDYTSSCSCQLVHRTGITLLEMVIVVVVIAAVCTTVSLVQCRRHRVGLFRRTPRIPTHRQEII